jgi:hypothetical protein
MFIFILVCFISREIKHSNTGKKRTMNVVHGCAASPNDHGEENNDVKHSMPS